MAPDDGQDGQQQRVAGQLAQGRRLPHRGDEAVAHAVGVGQVGLLRRRPRVPPAQELVDLVLVEVLQREVGELGLGEGPPRVADDARRDDDPDARELRAELDDPIGDLGPVALVEDLVEAVEDEQRTAARFQVVLEGLPFQA